MTSAAFSGGRKQLSMDERRRFEKHMADIFSRLGMELNTESCRRTPQRWVQALVDMTKGYNGDPNIEVVFERECVNCADELPTVQIVQGPIEFASLCEHHVLPFIGEAYIGCLRHEKIIGLSKFSRVVRKYAHRFTIQERIAQEVWQMSWSASLNRTASSSICERATAARNAAVSEKWGLSPGRSSGGESMSPITSW